MLKNLISNYKTSFQIYENRLGKISADEKTGENFLKKKKIRQIKVVKISWFKLRINMAASNGDQVNLVVKWAGKEYPIDNLPLASTVQQLKSAIHGKTNVLPSRQKLLNLRFKGKAPSDDQCLNQMRLVDYLVMSFSLSEWLIISSKIKNFGLS